MSVLATRPAATPRTAGPSAPRTGTPLSLDRVLAGFPEAAWLYALLTVPVAFDIALTRNFDLLKTVALRGTMSLLVLAAIVAFALAPWLRRGADWLAWPTGRLERAAFSAALAVLAVVALATATSVVPRVSVAGSHLRNWGLFTEAMYFVLFAAVALAMRRFGQLERAYDALVVAASISATYGVIQGSGLDPLRGGFTTGLNAPVFATLGNSGFYGSFLAVTIVVTAARLIAVLAPHPAAAPVEPSGAGLRFGLSWGLGAVPLLVLMNLGVRRSDHWWLTLLVAAGSILVLADTRLPRPAWWTRRHDAAVYGLALAAQTLCLILTRSRTAWIAAAVAVLVFGLAVARSIRLRLLVGASAAMVLGLVALLLVITTPSSPLAGLRELPGLDRVSAAVGVRNTIESRAAIWADLIALVRSDGGVAVDGDRFGSLRTALGYGPGTLYLVGERFASPRRLAAESSRIDRAHNEFLDRLVSTGALGFAAWVGFAAATLGLALVAVRRGARTGRRWPAAAAAGAVAAIFLGDMTGPGDPTSRVLFWFFAGVLASGVLRRAEPASAASTVQPPPVPARAPRGGRRAPTADQTRARWPAPSATLAALAASLALAAVSVGMTFFEPPNDHSLLLAVVSAIGGLMLVGLAWLYGAPTDPSDEPNDKRPTLSARLQAGALLGFCLLAAPLFWRNVRPAEADMYNRAALLLSDQGDKPAAAGYARWAIAISPNEELYYMILGGALSDIATVAPDRASGLPGPATLAYAVTSPLADWGRLSKRDFLALSGEAFEQARRLNPYDPVHYQNLTAYHSLRAELGEAGAREEALRQAGIGASLSPMTAFFRDDIRRLSAPP